jgi:hypothetical protein
LKKRSGASSTNEPPEPLVVFVDRSLGNKIVAAALRLAGAAVEIHDDHFPTTAPDEDWLHEVGRRRWVVLTKDRGIRYRAPALVAIRASATRMFVLTAGDLQGAEMAAIVVTALPRIARVVGHEPAPFHRENHEDWWRLSAAVWTPAPLKTGLRGTSAASDFSSASKRFGRSRHELTTGSGSDEAADRTHPTTGRHGHRAEQQTSAAI